MRTQCGTEWDNEHMTFMQAGKAWNFHMLPEGDLCWMSGLLTRPAFYCPRPILDLNVNIEIPMTELARSFPLVFNYQGLFFGSQHVTVDQLVNDLVDDA